MNNEVTISTPVSRGYKAKTIAAIIRRKVNEWLDSIDDEGLREDCRKEVVVTGGCIASMLLGESVNDYDVYFKSKGVVRRVAEYYLSKFEEAKKPQAGVKQPMFVEEVVDTQGKARVRLTVKSAGVASEDAESDYAYFEARPDHEAGDYAGEVFDDIETQEDEGELYRPVFLSSNAVSLSGKVQLILRFYGEPEEIHQSYDFAHCMNYWTYAGGLCLSQPSLEALLSKTLVYHGSQYPLCSIIRSKKFIARGWRINAGQYLKMAMQISELDLTNHEVLEEQLTGVDVAYFAQVVAAIKEKSPEKVDATYLVEVIDRML